MRALKIELTPKRIRAGARFCGFNFLVWKTVKEQTPKRSASASTQNRTDTRVVDSMASDFLIPCSKTSISVIKQL